MIGLSTRVFLLLIASCLAACGGGDGGGGSGGRNGFSILLDKSTVSLHAGAMSQTVVATFRGDGVVVGSLPGTTKPSWLSVSAPTTGTSPVTITLSVFQQMPAGRYSTTLRVATGKADGSEVVYQDITVTYTSDHLLSPSKLIQSRTAGTAGSASLTTLSLSTNGASWEATSDQPWLSVTPTSGTGSATLNVSVSPSLASGQYTGTITVRDTVTNRTRTTTMDLAVSPRRLTAQPCGVALTSTAGSSVLTRTVKVIDTANLGGRWTASDDAPWLQLAPSADGSSLTLTADATGLSDSIHYATVTIAPDSEPGPTRSCLAPVAAITAWGDTGLLI